MPGQPETVAVEVQIIEDATDAPVKEAEQANGPVEGGEEAPATE